MADENYSMLKKKFEIQFVKNGKKGPSPKRKRIIHCRLDKIDDN